MTSPWVRGSLVRHRGGRGAGAGGASGPIAPNIALLTPHSDGTISLTDRGSDAVTVTTTRATSGWIQDYLGVWTLVGAGVPRIMGARYDTGTYYYTDGSGNELRPTRTVTVGSYSWKHFDSYKPWSAAESGIAVGDRRLPLTRSGNAAAVTYAGASPTGYYYECTAITTGTCDGTEPAWPETLTNTVVDGGVTWTCQGLYTLSGLMVEQAATNSILQSRAFTTTWTATGTPTSAQDQTGYDGSATTAWTLGDDDGAATESFDQAVTVANDGNTHLFALLVKKDSTESRFPYIEAVLSGGTGKTATVQLNTKTGGTVEITSSVAAGFGSVDLGDWWWAWLTLANNTTGNTTLTCTIKPAGGTVSGTASTAATGTAVFDHAQLYLATSTLPATPGLATTTTAATRNADNINLPKPSWFDAAGTVMLDSYVKTWVNQARILGIAGTGTTPVYNATTTDGAIGAYDGTSADNMQSSELLPAGTANRVGTIWSGSSKTIAGNNGEGTAGSNLYDGGWGGTTLHLGSANGSSNILNGTLLNVILLQTDIGATALAAATARDAT